MPRWSAVTDLTLFTPGAPAPPRPLRPSEFHFQVRPGYLIKRHAMRAVIFAFDHDVAVFDPTQAPFEISLAVDRVLHHELRAPSSESLVITRAPERAIQSRRRDFEHIRSWYHIVDVENRAHVAADERAIFDAHAVFRRRRRTGPIDLNAQHHAAGFTPELYVEN